MDQNLVARWCWCAETMTTMATIGERLGFANGCHLAPAFPSSPLTIRIYPTVYLIPISTPK